MSFIVEVYFYNILENWRLYMGRRYMVFLRWWLMFMLIGLGSVITYNSGIFNKVNAVDITHLSLSIYTIFMFTTGYIGVLTWKASAMKPLKKLIKVFNHRATIGWFISDVFLTIGMIGTLAGFIYMFNVLGFENMSPDEIARILRDLPFGAMTALYTTISGLICSVILKFQLFNLDYHLESMLIEDICEEI